MYKPRTLADAVDKVAHKSAGKDWGLYATLLDHWTEIVGAEYARVTTPVKISFPYQPKQAIRSNGVLTIRLPKGLAMAFSFKESIIKQRVNAFFGYNAFARVVLEAAHIPPPIIKAEIKVDPQALGTIKQTAASIEDKELREALEQFGESMLLRKAKE